MIRIASVVATYDEGALPRRGYLGFAVEAQPAPPELLHEGPERWIVSEVDQLGASEAPGGLQLGDDLIFVDEARIGSLAELRARAASVPPGTSASIRVVRAGQVLDVLVRSRQMPLERLGAGNVELDQVEWKHGGRSHRLRAIWTHPSERETSAAVWLLPSATWMTQECPLDPHDPTFKLIDVLTANGISTLRIDRSGLGDSEGPPVESLDFEAEMSMWDAGRRYFIDKTQGTRRCLWGRSLGGMLAPMIANGAGIDAICVLGTSSLRWHEAMLESMDHQYRLRGQSGGDLRVELARIEKLQRLVYLEGLTPEEAREQAPELRDLAVTEYAGTFVFDRVCSFFQQMQRVSIEERWSRYMGEVLALHAEYDIIVPERAVVRLAAALGAQCRFMSLLGVDHFMHQRGSLTEAIERPWGGDFSLQAAQVVSRFFRGDSSVH